MTRHRTCAFRSKATTSARRAARLPLLAVATLGLLATACREPIQVVEIELPDGVLIPPHLNSVGFTNDDSRIYTNALIDGFEGRHIATLARDGSDFQCLTCADLASPDLNLRQPVLTHDGRRFAVRSGDGRQRHSIVECEGIVPACGTASLIPVQLPINAVVLRNARLEVSPDGEHALFTHVRADGLIVPILGDLVREHDPDRYVVVNAKALAGFRPTFTGPPDALELAVGNWGEAKGFTDGGASVLYYTTIDSLNYDSVKLDLATGDITRLTSHPEYDEDVHISPDGRWVAQASFRNYERLSIFSLVPRPPIIDAALRGPIALLRNQAGRRFFDMWTLPVGFARLDTKIARQVKDPSEPNDLDFNSRGQNRWNQDGTQLVFTEEDANALDTARLKLATYPRRKPSNPTPVVLTPDPTWAPPLQTVLPPNESTAGTLPGSASGHAEVAFILNLAPLSAEVDIRVEYFDFSNDGCSFLNGIEIVTVVGLDYTWDADLTVTGCHDGFLQASAVGFIGVVAPQRIEGTAIAEYDGVRVEGLPAPPWGE